MNITLNILRSNRTRYVILSNQLLPSRKSSPIWQYSIKNFSNIKTTHFSHRRRLEFSPFITHSKYTTTIVMSENRYAGDYAKVGTSSCKKCKTKIGKGEFRIAKVTANFFHDGDGEMKQYHHPACLFETFIKARSTTKIIEAPDDIEGFANLEKDEKDLVNKLIKETMDKKGTPKKKTPAKAKAGTANKTPTNKTPNKPSPAAASSTSASSPVLKMKAEPRATTSDDQGTTSSNGTTTNTDTDPTHKDNAFRNFRRLCAEIAEENSYGGKTKIVQNYIRQGSGGGGFQGDLYLLIKMLLPGVIKTVYNINSKQLVKVFSQVFGESLEEMVEDLEQGDVAETVRVFFEKSQRLVPQKKSTLNIQERSLCCRSVKLLGDVELCSEPCCHGLTEVAAESMIGVMVMCQASRPPQDQYQLLHQFAHDYLKMNSQEVDDSFDNQ